MEKLKPREILKRVKKEGFDQVWRESRHFFTKPEKKIDFHPKKPGRSHPIFDLIQRMRESFLNMGFTEVSNPIIVDEAEVYKQYGSEAPVILDRCFYLAALPRPDIGLSKEKYQQMERCGVELTESKTMALQQVLRDYKKGKIDSDDLVEKISDSLDVPYSMATTILSTVFPEFANLNPEPSTLTLRSHMTSSWFLTLEGLQHKLELPIKLFSVDVRFRREQREDALHLRAHHAASCVVMGGDVDVNDGEEITRALLKPLGFNQFRFVQKKVTSKYYVPETEYESYFFHTDMNQWVEISDYGIYNPIALARYNLEYPVLNVGIGVERVSMALYGETDVRRLVHPQFYVEPNFSDDEIAKMVKVDIEPQTELGSRLWNKIESAALNHADALGPCEFLAHEEEMPEKMLRVYVYTPEEEARLLGSAALSSIFVCGGNVLSGMKRSEEHTGAQTCEGVPVGISYLHAVAALAAAKIEGAVISGTNEVNFRIKMAKRASDVNIKIADVARRYITSNRKKIRIEGPVFVGVRAEIVGKV